MTKRARVAARMTLSVAAVAALSGGCAAFDQFQHTTTLTFRVDTLECGPPTATSIVCQFFAYYGNVSKKPIQIDPTSTKVVDRKGNVVKPVAGPGAGDSFLLKPGLQHAVSWSVTLPATAKPARVTWHGTSVPVLLDVAPTPSASAAASGPASAVPSTTPVPSLTPSAAATTSAATTPVAPTTTKATTTKPKPTTTKPKPTTKPTTAKPTTASPTTTRPPVTTPPPPTHTTTRPPVIHHTTPPTTNPTNPGGGSGGIG
jgi:hypothetical protein